ncbi:MAG: DUF262 domain-containing protein [Limisphaerales bacterium]
MIDSIHNLCVTRVNVMELLGKQDEHFKIPHYQRKYAWESVNCHVFLDDILEVANEKRKTHFFSNLTVC